MSDDNPMTCKHEDFETHVAVHRFEDTGEFMVDIKVNCRQCGRGMSAMWASNASMLHNPDDDDWKMEPLQTMETNLCPPI